MKSNLNFKILKLCISEICLQVGFDKISEQSINILSDVLKYYIIQMSLKLYKTVGSNIFPEGSTDFLLQEKDLIPFLKSQNNLKKYSNDIGNNKSLLHSLRILTNEQFFNDVNHNNINELDYEPKLKTTFVNDTIEKDEELKKFIETCLVHPTNKNKTENIEFDFMNILDHENHSLVLEGEKGSLYQTSDHVDIWNEIQDVLMDYNNLFKYKIFKTID